MKKVQISIEEDLMKRIDEYTKKNYLSRSAFFAQIAQQHLVQSEVITALKKLQVAMESIAKRGEVSDEDMQELRNFEILATLLIGK